MVCSNYILFEKSVKADARDGNNATLNRPNALLLAVFLGPCPRIACGGD